MEGLDNSADRIPPRNLGADRARARVQRAGAARGSPTARRPRSPPSSAAGLRPSCWRWSSRLSSTAGAAAAIGDPAALRAALSREMRSAGGASGAWVYDGGSERTVFKWNAAKRRVPASVQKLVTTAAALDRLGPEARFETAVLATGEVAEGTLDGDLYLRGSGDPTFGTTALERLADAVAETGVERVDGRICGDETFFDRLRGGPASRLRHLAVCRAAVGAGVQPRVGLWPFGARMADRPRRRSWPSGCASRCGATT